MENAPDNLLIIDLETNGLSPDKGHQTIEIGAILWNMDKKAMLQSISTLVPCKENAVENINHISPELTQRQYSVTPALVMIETMAFNSSAIVAHNAQFDHKFLKTINGFMDHFWDIPWVCTKQDIRWPFPLPRKRLQDICEVSGIEYKSAHRSLTDCHLLGSCLEKVLDLKDQITKLIKK